MIQRYSQYLLWSVLPSIDTQTWRFCVFSSLWVLMQMYVLSSLEFISPFLNRPHHYYGSLAFVAQNHSGFYKKYSLCKETKA